MCIQDVPNEGFPTVHVLSTSIHVHTHTSAYTGEANPLPPTCVLSLRPLLSSHGCSIPFWMKVRSAAIMTMRVSSHMPDYKSRIFKAFQAGWRV